MFGMSGSTLMTHSQCEMGTTKIWISWIIFLLGNVHYLWLGGGRGVGGRGGRESKNVATHSHGKGGDFYTLFLRFFSPESTCIVIWGGRGEGQNFSWSIMGGGGWFVSHVLSEFPKLNEQEGQEYVCMLASLYICYSNNMKLWITWNSWPFQGFHAIPDNFQCLHNITEKERCKFHIYTGKI